MKRLVVAVSSWLGATGLAVLLVNAGVGEIRDTTRRDTALAATRPSTDDTAGPGRAVVSTSSAGTDATRVGALPGSDPGVGSASGSAGATSIVASVATTTAPAPAPAPSTPVRPPLTAPPLTTPTVTTPTVTSPTVPAPTTTTTRAATTATIAALGGIATIRYSATAVTVVAATPSAGRTAKVDQRGATAVRVEFEGGGHRSRIEAWWDDGPRQDVRED